jgi:hypothetical protein
MVQRRLEAAATIELRATLHGFSPPHDHIRFDHLPCPFEVGPRFVHVEADGVDFVAGRFG